MKQVHANYTFVASTKTITLTGLNIDQDQLLLITNATRGVIYYNFASSSHRATVTAGADTTVVLTDASTTGHADSDQLTIYYDDQLKSGEGAATSANQTTANASLSNIDAKIPSLSSGRIPVDVGNPVSVSGAVTVGNSVTIGSLPAISGTVTANVSNITDFATEIGINAQPNNGVQLGFYSESLIEYRGVSEVNGLPISGTVTANSPNGAVPLTAAQRRGTTSATANTSSTAPSPNDATNPSRKYLLFQNISDTDMYINFGAAATTNDLLVPKNGGGIVFESGFVPTDSVNVICSAASKKYFILSA